MRHILPAALIRFAADDAHDAALFSCRCRQPPLRHYISPLLMPMLILILPMFIDFRDIFAAFADIIDTLMLLFANAECAQQRRADAR